MALADNPRLPLTSGNTPVMRYMETRSEHPQQSSTSITMTTMSNSNRGKDRNNLPVNEYELRRLPTRQRRVVKKTLMAHVGYRLAKRKDLHIRR